MKKVILATLAVGLVAGGQAFAQSKKAEFSLNLGVQTNVGQGTAFDYALFTLDGRLGLAIEKSFELSPEVMLMVDDSLDFSLVWLYPGVMLNYKAGHFFFGAGAVLTLVIEEGRSAWGNPAIKINIGYKPGKLMFTVYAMIWTGTSIANPAPHMGYIGTTIGYRF